MAQNSAYYSQQQQPQRQYTQAYPQSQPQNIYQQLGKPQPQPHLQGHPTYQQPSALVVQPQGGYPFSQQLPAQVQSSFPVGEAPRAPPRTPYQSQIPHVSPQTPYPQSQTPYLPSQPPYTQSQASYPVSQSQQPYTSSQNPYQQAQYPGQQQSQQAYSSLSQLQPSYVPQTPFNSQTPAAVPTSSSGSSWRVSASWPPPVAPSATLAQQAQSQIQTQVQPQATIALISAQRPLPQPSTGANLPFTSQSAENTSSGSSRPFPKLAIQATVVPSSDSPSPKRSRPLPTPTGATGQQPTVDIERLPHAFSTSLANSVFSTQSSISSQPQPQPITTKRTPSPTKRPLPAPSSHSPVKKAVGLSRTSSFAILNSESASSVSSTPKRTGLPKFQSQPSSESSSPTKENAPASSLPWNKFSGSTAAVSTNPKSTSTATSSSISTTSAATPNSTSDTSVPPPKKFTPIWKHTIPDYPAPAWGYAVGMVSEPHPKPKAQLPTQPAPAKAPPANDAKGKLKKENESVAPPPPPVPAVLSTKGTTQRQQYSPSQYRQSGQPSSTSFIQSGVQQQQAYSGDARSPTYSETQDEDDEDEEEEGEETDSDEDDDEDEEQPDPRYNPQNGRQKYTRAVASIANGAGVPSQSLSRGYDQNFEEEMTSTPTPKRKLRLKPKAKMDDMDPYTAYIDVNASNGRKGRIVPRRGQDEDITPKVTKNVLKPKKLIPSDDHVGFRAVKRHTVHLWDALDDDGQGERKRFQVHERSRSAYEERGREVAVAKQRRQLERKAGSAFSVDDGMIIRKRQDEDDREVGLAYDDDEEEEEEEVEVEDTRMRGRRQVMKNGTPGGTPERRKGQVLRVQGASPQWEIRESDIPANRRGPSSVTRYGINYKGDSEIAGGTGVPEKSIKGGPRWKSTPLKYDDYDHDDGGEDVGGRRELEMQFHQQEEMTRKFAALRMNDGTSFKSVRNQGSTGLPADLPHLPQTPGSSSASGSVTDDGGDYFDAHPQQVPVISPVSGFRQLRSTGVSGKMNISLEDPHSRVTARSSSLDPPVPISRRQPLPQPPRHPENQTYSTSGADDRIGQRLQLRRSLYSDPETMQVHEEEGLKKRPQSQIYMSATTRIQVPIGSHNRQQQQLPHLPFSNQTMHNSANYQSQTPAPLPIVGIESPHPVGGRDKLADIPMLEEGSNDESEGEHRQQPNHRRVQVPRINVASDPSSSPPLLPRIQVDGSGPSIPSINLNSLPRMNGTINNDSGPIINIEPPRINVDSGDSPRDGGGPNISVSGPGSRNLHSHHHAQSISQQLQFGQQTHGRQARPAGGLICGGCNGSIIGRIVSAMGSRWHPTCFRCTVCDELLEHVSSYEHEGRPYCHLDYHENFAPRCYSCKTAIIEEQFISLDDPALGKRTYHTQHFFCAECGDPFLSPSVSFPDSKGEVALSGDGEFEGFTVYKGHPYCEACHVRLRLPKCKRCKRSIRDHDEAVEALGGKWCWGCFVCATCNEPFENPSFFQRDDKPFCERCFSIMLRNEV